MTGLFLAPGRLNNRCTHSGCRTGRSKKRPIAVLINPCPPPSVTVRHEICIQNLIRIDSECDTPSVRQVSFCLLNARSVIDVKQAGKATMICDLIKDNDIDILAITETRLNADDSISIGCVTPASDKHATCPENVRHWQWRCRRRQVWLHDATTRNAENKDIRIDKSTSRQ